MRGGAVDGGGAQADWRAERERGEEGWWRLRTCPVEAAEAPSPGSCSSTRSFCRPGSSSFSTELQPGPAGPNFSQPLDQIILLIFVEE
jgi:hypothetical protein